MSRFGSTVRTYGRNPSKDSASKAFDAVFDSKPSASMATSTVHKFGTYRFTSTRAKDSEVEPRKRKVDSPTDVFDDPFSFDSDGENSSAKKAKSSSGLTTTTKTGGVTKTSLGAKSKKTTSSAPPPPPSSNNGRTLNTVIIARKKKLNDDDEDEFVVKKGPARTYRSHVQESSKSKVADTTAAKKTSSSTIGGGSRQLSMDSFTRKLATLSPPQKGLVKDSIFSYNASKKKAAAQQKAVVKKFFTSSQDCADLDHNYSVSPRRPSPSQDSDNESGGSFNNFALDSDQELDSGDPEIIFNSPKKRHQQGENVTKDVYSDMGMDTEGRASPASMGGGDYATATAAATTTITTESKSSQSQEKDRTPASSVHSDDDKDDDDDVYNIEFKPKGPTRTFGTKLVLKKSSSEVMGIGKKESIPTFSASGVPNSKRNSDGERKFTALVGKKLEDEVKKPEKKPPLVRRLLTSPKKVSSFPHSGMLFQGSAQSDAARQGCHRMWECTWVSQ